MTLTAYQQYQDEYRQKWLAQIVKETTRLRREELDFVPKTPPGRPATTPKLILEVLSQKVKPNETFTWPALGEWCRELMEYPLSDSALRNHTKALVNSGKIKLIYRGNGGRYGKPSVWRYVP
jgi:hypothetical protein